MNIGKTYCGKTIFKKSILRVEENILLTRSLDFQSYQFNSIQHLFHKI